MADTAFEQLVATLERIRQITRPGYGEAVVARNIPSSAVAEFRGLELRYRSSNRDPSEGAARLHAGMMAYMAKEAEERGRERRDKTLRALALELEGLRETLPDLAARACKEIGALARDLADEAAGRSDENV